MPRPGIILTALFLGLAAGILIASSGAPALLALAAAVEPIGTLWINALRMVVVPLVVSLLVVGVSSIADIRTVGRVGGRSLAVWLLLLAISAGIGLTLVPFLYSGLSIDPATTGSLRESAASMADSTTQGLERMPSYTQWLIDLVPTNPVRAAADGAMLPLVVFSIALGLAATRIRPVDRESLIGFFRAAAEAMLVLVRWVLMAAPVGVFALSLGVAARMGLAAAGAIGYYIGVTAISLLTLIAAFYVVATLVAGLAPRAFARAVLPAQLVGFTSRSSLASLPAQVEGATSQLNLPPHATGFVLPLAVSSFKPHAPVNWAGLIVFTGLLYGVQIGPAELLTVVVSAALLSFAVPGIPSAGMLLSAPIFVSLGLPVEALGILIAVDAIPDMFKTVANVTGQFTSGVLVARFSRGDDAAESGALSVEDSERPLHASATP